MLSAALKGSAATDSQVETTSVSEMAAQSSSISARSQRSSSFNAPTPVNTPAVLAPIQSSNFSNLLASKMSTEQSSSAAAPSKADVAGILAQNPAIMAALQNRLGKLVGQSSGYVESLPAPIKKRLRALEKLQLESNKLDRQMEKEIRDLERKYFDKKGGLFEKRALIVNGQHEPTEEECVPVESEDTENVPADPEATGTELKGIPQFWLTCLQNVPHLQAILTEKDEGALKHLKDIRVKHVDDAEQELTGFKLEFEFESNDYFEETLLTKAYFVQEPSEDDDVDGMMFDHAEGCAITWKKDKDLTHKVELRKQRHKSSNKTRVVKKVVKTDSFFNFFNPPNPEQFEGDDEDEYDELQESMEMDYELGEFLRDNVVPNALKWFTGEALEDLQEDSEDEEQEDEDGSDEEGASDDSEDDDEEQGDSAPNQQQPPECKQQ